jgi:tetratricopeptide (TPR) repeat protein
MNRNFILVCLLAFTRFSLLAQDTDKGTDSKSLQETAKSYIRQGDYANAIIVLNGAIKKDPGNIELVKDLAFDYYLQQEYAKGLAIARPLTERPDADVQCYQLAALFYKAVEDVKECDKLYKAGIKRFPQSGVLYSEYGEMLAARQDYSAIKLWEKGIEVDPNYSSNYYHASKYYYFAGDKAWGLIYGEIFVNLESYTKRTFEIRDILLEGYKKLFSETDAKKDAKPQSPFTTAFLDVMYKQSGAVAQGVNAETLTTLRTKFILSWYNQYPSNFPFRLFDFQRQLIKDGMFDAYNQWLFGDSGNPADFKAWTSAHSDEYNRFTTFQKGRIFKLPNGQYYQIASK